jgi:ribosomal protein L18
MITVFNHRNVNAKINTKELARAMDKGNTVKIENASAVGRVIANELSKGYNRRNII